MGQGLCLNRCGVKLKIATKLKQTIFDDCDCHYNVTA